MFDRGIAIVGIALAILAPILQYNVPKLATWATGLGFGVGCFLLGLAFGINYVRRDTARSTKPLERARLLLHIYPDFRQADRLEAENIFRWYYLRQYAISEQGHAGIGALLFVTFDHDVQISNLKVQSPNIQLPPFEVKEFNQRYAIVIFGGVLSEGTLKISVHP